MFKKIKQYLGTPEIAVIGLSILITVIISCVLGTAGYLFLRNFWGTFLLSLGVQFVVFFIVNTFLQRKDELETAKIVNDQLETLSKYIVRLTCSYCSKPNNVPIILNRENRFKCEFCQQTNGVKMQFFSTQITTPLEKITLSSEDISTES